MHFKSSRVIQWQEVEASVLEIPIEGIADAPPPGAGCEPSRALVYAGHGRTGGGGSWRLSLPAISCLQPVPGGDRRPSVVATPTDAGMHDSVARPYLLVARTNGAEITIWSYHPNGTLAPAVEFSWHVVVERTLVKAG